MVLDSLSDCGVFCENPHSSLPSGEFETQQNRVVLLHQLQDNAAGRHATHRRLRPEVSHRIHFRSCRQAHVRPIHSQARDVFVTTIEDGYRQCPAFELASVQLN